MSMFCNVMLLLLYVHVCVTRTGWKTRPQPKTVILLIKQSINLCVSISPYLPVLKNFALRQLQLLPLHCRSRKWLVAGQGYVITE